MIGLEELRKRNVRVGCLLRIVGSEAVVAHPQVQRDAAFNRPSVLKEEAGVAKIVFLRGWSVVRHNLERRERRLVGSGCC